MVKPKQKCPFCFQDFAMVQRHLVSCKKKPIAEPRRRTNSDSIPPPNEPRRNEEEEIVADSDDNTSFPMEDDSDGAIEEDTSNNSPKNSDPKIQLHEVDNHLSSSTSSSDEASEESDGELQDKIEVNVPTPTKKALDARFDSLENGGMEQIDSQTVQAMQMDSNNDGLILDHNDGEDQEGVNANNITEEDPNIGRVLNIPIDDPIYESRANSISRHNKGMLRLIDFCDSHNCSRQFTDDLIILLAEICRSDPFSSEPGFSAISAVRRETFTKNVVTNLYSRPELKPNHRKVTLPAPGSSRSYYIPENGPRNDDGLARIEEISTSLRNRVTLVTWDVRSGLEHLLEDRRVFGDLKNLVVNQGTQRWAPYRSDGSLDDVMDGKWYHRTLRDCYGIDPTLVADSENPRNITEFVAPIILYGDKTGTDIYQRYSLEPFVFTTALIRRFLRYQPWTWRLLGFVPDLERKSRASKKTAKMGESMANYHFCFTSLLEGFEEVGINGFITYLRLGEEMKKVRLYCPIVLILGDGKNGDTLVCRYGGFSEGTHGLSRRCHVSYEESDDPNHECSFRDRQSVLDALVQCESMDVAEREEAHEKLKGWSIHRVRNAFEEAKVPFGSNFGRGHFGALATDLMHASDHGVIVYIVKLAIDCLPPKKKKALDDLVDGLFGGHRSHLKKEMPKTNFTKGFTNLTLLTSDEWVGCLYTIAVLLKTARGRQVMQSRFSQEDISEELNEVLESKLRGTDRGLDRRIIFRQAAVGLANEKDAEARQKLQRSNQSGEILLEDSEEENAAEQRTGISQPSNKKKKGRKRREDDPEIPLRKCSVYELLHLVEALLCFHSFYKREEPIPDWDASVKWEVDTSIRRLQWLIRLHIPRESGNGWHLQKFHDILHVPTDMDEYGLPQNYNCGSGESGLKYWAKFASQTAQQRGPDKFVAQVAERIYEYQCFSDALTDIGHPKHKLPLPPGSEPVDISPPKLGGSSVKIYKGRSRPPKWSGRDKNRKGFLELHPVLENYFQENEEIIGAKIPTQTETDRHTNREHEYWTCYTECDFFVKDMDKRQAFRAHPNYHNEGAWYDWALVLYEIYESGDEEEDGSSTATTAELYPCKILGFLKQPGDDDNVFAIVHPCAVRTKEMEDETSVLFQVWRLLYEQPDTPASGRQGRKQYQADDSWIHFQEWDRKYRDGTTIGLSNENGDKGYLGHRKASLDIVNVESISRIVECYEENNLRLTEGITDDKRYQTGPVPKKRRANYQYYQDSVILTVDAWSTWGNKFCNLQPQR